MYNSEEKVQEITRLLEILSKRKKYSIVVAMLLVYQKLNFQKLLKDFLIQGVKDYIQANPNKVVSYNGIPFTVKNCFMGMRVIIGKNRIFQKEMIDGCEYLNVNLVQTCIFLSDEIAKICKGSKNSRPIHSSLLDELDIEEKGLQGMLGQKRDRDDEYGNDELSKMSEGDKKDEELGIGDVPPSKKKKGGKNSDSTENDNSNKKKIIGMNIIGSTGKIISSNGDNANDKIKNNIMSNKTIFFPKDTNYLKCPLQDYLTIWNFGKFSPVNLYLKDNIQNIFKIRSIFALIKEVGENGQKYIENLAKYIPNATSEKKEEQDEINQINEKLFKINNTYNDYNEKKKKLIQIYQRLKSTVENMKLGGYNPDKNIIEDDTEYLNIIAKKYDDLLKEIYPLFDEIFNYGKDCPIKNIGTNLFNLSKTLKENELIYRLFQLFSQNLVNLFPHEGNNINTLSDLLMDEKLTEKEREEKFYEIAARDKNNLLKSAEPIKKMAFGIDTNNNENQNGINAGADVEKDQKLANDENANENENNTNNNEEKNNNANNNYKDNENNKVEIIQNTA
jgi:hypothetical protein